MRQSAITPLQQFYRTGAQPCPYLPGEMERKVITDLLGDNPQALYNELSRAGFRRSHHYAYRPVCNGCTACVPVRIPVEHFVSQRSGARLARTNADLRRIILPSTATQEGFELFATYLACRHHESDMAGMGFDDYRAMLEDSPLETVLVGLADEHGALAGVCLTDVLDDGLSAVYSFYRTDNPKRGLGTYLVMQLIEQARELSLPYVYLGYWIPGSRKMTYKTRFQPLEALGPSGWYSFKAG